eukprot:m.278009 g.278009  ORF g.278009 m.278009 type:complete len:84 (+) comp15735_c0_seq5:1475-1726(+)
MKLLLRLGADPKEECALGNALHGAAQSGVVECVKLLLDLGVQADLKSSKTRVRFAFERLYQIVSTNLVHDETIRLCATNSNKK